MSAPAPSSRARLRKSFFAALALLACLAPWVRGATGIESTPLGRPSGPQGVTMFTTMRPEQTGIVVENSYADPRMWAGRDQEFALGSIGTGVAIGDYDGDGRPDVFVVNKTGQSRLFRNLGGWKFEDVTARAGLIQESSTLRQGLSWVKGLMGGAQEASDIEAWKQGATLADINNDGWLDLYVCRFNAPNFLYVNQGDGTFKEEAAARGLAVVDASVIGAFCDYDRDGWLDVYVQANMLDAVNHPNGRRGYLFRNLGAGRFEDVTAKAGIYGETLSHSSTWWDFDRDGWPDLYVANDFGEPDRLYRNNGNGTFTDVIHDVMSQLSYSAMGSDIGDVDNDGRVDLFVADMATTSHEKDQRGMAAARELTRDDSDSATKAPQILRNTLQLNTGTSRFLEAAALAGLAATDWTWSVRFEDLDNDGWIDLHVTNGMIREYNNDDLRQRVVLAENLEERSRLMKDSPVLNEPNLAYRNEGGLRFSEVGPAWGLAQNGVSFGAAFGDLDGDGDLDLVVANYEAPPTVLRNDSPGGHRLLISLRGTGSNRFGVGAFVRIETDAGVQVREFVQARGYISSSEPVIHFGLGDVATVRSLTVEWPGGHVQRFENLPADRRYTIVEPEGTPPPRVREQARAPQFVEEGARRGLAVVVEDRLAQGSIQPLMPLRFDRRGPALAWGDLDGDGRDDFVIGGSSQQGAQFLRQSVDGTFLPAGGLASGELDDGPLLVFDANGDGRSDLLQTKAGVNRPVGSPDYQPVLHLGNASGLSPAPPGYLPPLPMSVGAAVAADFDRDGRLDLFLGARVVPGRYPLAPRSALLRNNGGGFDDVTDALAPLVREAGMVTSALWSDVDRDGWIDLLVALEWGGVKYFRNEQGRGFSDRSETAGFAGAGNGWWNSLATADFNGDGVCDYVAGNNGLNTAYRADGAHPATLFYGRFAAGGSPQLIEAQYEGERLYPRRTSRAIGGFVPNVRRRFPKNDDYARATLEEILGADRLAAAQRFTAGELRHGVFLSQPDGTWRFEALPHIAQIAPFQGIVAGDFDGDGHADVYAVQNSYAPVPFVGRFDGGLSQLLLGDGRGGFTAVAPRESGLIVPGDAKALAVLDLGGDGWPGFVLTRNNGTTLAWRNAGVEGRHAFRVALEGPRGNARGIGARVVVRMSDGSTQVAEVQAGGGYYSQSSPALHFGYPSENPPRRIEVRWPDGRTSGTDFGHPPSGSVVLKAP